MNPSLLIGIDGGGTYTRAICTDLDGRILARAQTGGANPSKNADAEQNIQQAIAEALAQAGGTVAQIAGLVAGIAGLDDPNDMLWAERFTTVAGSTIKPTCVNDAVIAWAGALGLQPGIIVIAGTGCIIFGVNEQGRQVRNYDFEHYAAATARNLTFEAIFQILAGATSLEDQPLLARIFSHFGVDNILALANHAAENDRRDRRQLMKLYGDGAPLITAAAEQGSPLARRVCATAAQELAQGVRVVGSLFAEETIAYALIGSVARSPLIQQTLTDLLTQPTQNHHYHLHEPLLSPEAGAILLARQQLGLAADAEVIANLKMAIS